MIDSDIKDYTQFLRRYIPATLSRSSALAATGQHTPRFDKQEDMINYQNKVAAVYGAYELEALQLLTMQRVLEQVKFPIDTLGSLGCGPASLELWLVHTGKVQECTLVDISPAMCSRAERTASDLGIQRSVNVICAGVESANLPLGRADAILSINAMHWSTEWRIWLKIAASLLKKNGQAFLSATMQHPQSEMLIPQFVGVSRRYFQLDKDEYLSPPTIHEGKSYQLQRYFVSGRKK